MTEETLETPKAPKRRRMKKMIEGTVLTIETDTGKVLTFDFAELPKAIQDALGPFGLSNKIGDSAAGKKGQDAVDAMERVWNGLMEGNWTVRQPAAEKVSKKSILSKFEGMPEGQEKELAKNLLVQLGILSE